MAAATYVRTGRWLDAAVMALFLVVISSCALYAFGQMLLMMDGVELLEKYKVPQTVQRLLPYAKKRLDFNLTHALLFSIVICLLSMEKVKEDEPTKKTQKQEKTEKKQSVSLD